MTLYILYDEYKKKDVGISSCSSELKNLHSWKGGIRRHEVGRGLNWDYDVFCCKLSFFFSEVMLLIGFDVHVMLLRNNEQCEIL